jgi:hypothetical protein
LARAAAAWRAATDVEAEEREAPALRAAAADKGSSSSTDWASSAAITPGSTLAPPSSMDDKRLIRAAALALCAPRGGDARAAEAEGGAGLASTGGNEHALSACRAMSRSLMYRWHFSQDSVREPQYSSCFAVSRAAKDRWQ